MYPRPPRAKGFPKGRTFPSLTSTRKCQPSPAGGRRSALAQTDPPNIFSFPPGAAHFLFDVSKRKWGAHPCGNNPLAELAQQQLPKLRGCDAHFTVILSDVDENLLRRLGINVSCEARYETKKLYHK